MDREYSQLVSVYVIYSFYKAKNHICVLWKMYNTRDYGLDT